MVDHKVRLWLNDLFRTVTGAKEEFERIIGVSPDGLPTELLYGSIETLVDTEKSRRQEEREDEIRQEQQDLYAKIEQAKAEALRFSLNEVAMIIREGNSEDAQKLEQILISIDEGAKQVAAADSGGARKALPPRYGEYQPSPFIAYMDCKRKHPPTEEHSEGRPGPSQCIEARPYPDGMHYRCMVAFLSQNPEGYARIKYQIFHAELLRQGDCPKPYSRSILHRIPFRISWLLQRPDICPFANGSEYKLTPDGGFVEVTESYQPPTIGKDTWK